jgi:hypothetical protein
MWVISPEQNDAEKKISAKTGSILCIARFCNFYGPALAHHRVLKNPARAIPQKQGCHIFRGSKYQNRKNTIPNDHKIYQMATNISNGHKYIYRYWYRYQWPGNIPNGREIYLMAVKYT